MSYFDSTTKACVMPTNPMSNAFSYSNATTITQCQNGYYLANNQCVAIPLNNQNCINGQSTNGVFSC